MKSNTRIKSLRLDKDVIRKVEELAERENRNFTNMVETILKNEVGRLGI
ncbi:MULTISPECIES: ribbon-helix-helix protein, CopG family [unclassified Allomuricauda]|nr:MULTISPECIES: ribbon-helix-helix protein, CopG family [unclassified Allomuricauda]